MSKKSLPVSFVSPLDCRETPCFFYPLVIIKSNLFYKFAAFDAMRQRGFESSEREPVVAGDVAIP